jgi:hypothetical protein
MLAAIESFITAASCCYWSPKDADGLFGFGATSAHLRDVVEAALADLLEAGQLRLDGRLVSGAQSLSLRLEGCSSGRGCDSFVVRSTGHARGVRRNMICAVALATSR